MGHYKKYLAVFLILCMQFTTFHVAYASTATGGWNIGSAVAQGATTVYTATKEIGGKLVTSVAKITPTPAQIAKGLGKGLFAGLALSVAQKLIEDGVDFVLDPANNSIRYKLKKDKNKEYQYYYQTGSYIIYTLPEAQQVSNLILTKDFGKDSYDLGDCFPFVEHSHDYIKCTWDWKGNTPLNRSLTFARHLNPDYDQNAKNKYQTLPFTSVASQIITDANNNDEQAKAVTSAVAQSATESNTDDQLVPYTQLTQALDSSIPASQDDTKSPPTTNTDSGSQSQTQDQSKPDESASNPTATPSPNDAETPTDCKFFQTACTWFETVERHYTETKTAVTEYFNPPQENDTVDIDQPDKQNNPDTNISFNGSCPSSITLIDADFLGLPIHWEFQFTDFCMVLSKYVRPILILSGSFSALLIMGGRRDG